MFKYFRSIIDFLDPKLCCNFRLAFYELLEAHLLDNEKHSWLDEGE